MSKKQPNPLDVALGSRIRLRRREINMSQSDVGKSVCITFQEIQKYESGANRVSFSRLVDIAHALNCSINDLIGDLDKPAAGKTLFASHVDRLNEPGAAELLEAFSAIKSPKHRRAILNLAKQQGYRKSKPLQRVFEFGKGDLVVVDGRYNGNPAVFIRRAYIPGSIGDPADREGVPMDTLQPGEIVLCFPTTEQASTVVNALFVHDLMRKRWGRTA